MQQAARRAPALRTFQTFAPGQENELPYSAARRLGESPVTFMNPVVLVGPTSVGKTHLLDAVVCDRQRDNPNMNIRHLTGERFMFEFTTALRDREGIAFKELNYSADMFVVDALEFLASKDHTLAEFMYVVEYCSSREVQMLFSINESPGTISGIPDRLRSQLLHGLVTEIRPPGVELRRKIIARQFPQSDEIFPAEVLDLLAESLSDARVLIGAIHKLMTLKELGHQIGLEEVEIYMAAEMKAARKSVTVQMITAAVCTHFGITEREIKSLSRERRVARPRQVIMYLARELTQRSLPEIGRYLGGRDHTTVMHGRRTIEELLRTDLELPEAIAAIRKALS